jgi:hypothetical protein
MTSTPSTYQRLLAPLHSTHRPESSPLALRRLASELDAWFVQELHAPQILLCRLSNRARFEVVSALLHGVRNFRVEYYDGSGDLARLLQRHGINATFRDLVEAVRGDRHVQAAKIAHDQHYGFAPATSADVASRVEVFRLLCERFPGHTEEGNRARATIMDAFLDETRDFVELDFEGPPFSLPLHGLVVRRPGDSAGVTNPDLGVSIVNPVTIQVEPLARSIEAQSLAEDEIVDAFGARFVPDISPLPKTRP